MTVSLYLQRVVSLMSSVTLRTHGLSLGLTVLADGRVDDVEDALRETPYGEMVVDQDRLLSILVHCSWEVWTSVDKFHHVEKVWDPARECCQCVQATAGQADLRHHVLPTLSFNG